MYQYDQRPGTHITDASAPLLQELKDSEYSVLIGRNNCGKSYLLKSLTQQWGANASYLGPARYQNFNLLGFFTPSRNRKDERFRQFLNQWNQQQQNIDNSPVNLQQAIAELSDEQRDKLAEIMNILLGVKLQIRQTVETNSMSQKYISCGGHNLSYTSSGVRLIATLITCLLDSDYDTFLIDEPELGISPEAQGVLAEFLFNRERRKIYFPHVRTLLFATHSTIFLDRSCIRNNYCVEKRGDEIAIRRIESLLDFNRVHFFLLGNRFETLYLPSAIVLVEGKCDHRFVEHVVALRYPDYQLSIVSANSDARMKEVLNIARGLLTDIQKSPYRDRILALLDSVHSATLPAEMKAMGILEQNVIIWPKNGIEYFYPPSILDAIFGIGSEIIITGDIVSRNGISHTKGELVDKVVSLLRPDTAMNPDFERIFLKRVERVLGLNQT